MTYEYIHAGAIGAIREVHAWSDRPMGWWPQGVKRPADVQRIPETLDWDLWLGPVPGLWYVFNGPNRLYAGEGKKEPVDEIRHEVAPGSPLRLD